MTMSYTRVGAAAGQSETQQLAHVTLNVATDKIAEAISDIKFPAVHVEPSQIDLSPLVRAIERIEPRFEPHIELKPQIDIPRIEIPPAVVNVAPANVVFAFPRWPLIALVVLSALNLGLGVWQIALGK